MRVYDPLVPSLVTKAEEFASIGSVEDAFAGVEWAVSLRTMTPSGGYLWRLQRGSMPRR